MSYIPPNHYNPNACNEDEAKDEPLHVAYKNNDLVEVINGYYAGMRAFVVDFHIMRKKDADKGVIVYTLGGPTTSKYFDPFVDIANPPFTFEIIEKNLRLIASKPVPIVNVNDKVKLTLQNFTDIMFTVTDVKYVYPEYVYTVLAELEVGESLAMNLHKSKIIFTDVTEQEMVLPDKEQ